MNLDRCYQNRLVERVRRTTIFCLVCGDVARGRNFGVISCLPCKSFFRRNFSRPPGSLACNKENSCIITKENRSECSACRLKKCFKLGMSGERTSATDDPSLNLNDWRNRLPLPQPVDLIQQDRSMMTTTEWALLTNLIHAYDREDCLSRAQFLVAEQTAWPPKLRAKVSQLTNLVFLAGSTVQNLAKQSPDFGTLVPAARHRLIKNNIIEAIAVNVLIVNKFLGVSLSQEFAVALNKLLGPDILKEVIWIHEKMDGNLLLFKILISVVLFSSNSAMTRFDPADDLSTCAYTLDFIQIQNRYVSMLWKYMVYKFGYSEAIVRYSSLIATRLGVCHAEQVISNNIFCVHLLDSLTRKAQEVLSSNG